VVGPSRASGRSSPWVSEMTPRTNSRARISRTYWHWTGLIDYARVV
jgi:hypothetical protein